MFKPVKFTNESLNKAMQRQPQTTANNVFKVLQGYYGSLFLSKFSTGINGDEAKGEPKGDKGIANARNVWAYSLSSFSESTVVAALARVQEAHPEYPPSLPQFVKLCQACEPRQAVKYEPLLGMSDTLRSKYAREAREINERHAKKALQRRTGAMDFSPGLDGLKQAIAAAAADAGGDEATELLRLDRLLAVGGAR